MNSVNTINRSNYSPGLAQAFLLFYVFLASSFTGGVFSKQLQEFFSENRFAQHLIAFVMLLTLIILIGGVTSIDKAILYAVIGYALFLFANKADAHFSIVIILLLLLGFFLEVKMNEYDQSVAEDPNLTEEQKQNEYDIHYRYKVYYIFMVIGVILIGTMLYMGKKVEQYGGGANGSFDFITYLFF